MVKSDARSATPEDVIRLFRELLGRDLESEATLRAHLGQPVLDLAISIAKCQEYRDKISTLGLRELRLLAKTVPGAGALPEGWVERFRDIVEARPFSNSAVVDYLEFISDPEASGRKWPAITEPFGDFAVPESITIVIPTINSSGWIGDICRQYREAGLDPLFAVDSRGCDDTEGALKDLGVRYAIVASPARRVESLLPAIAASSPTDWVLRLDDDELPSGGLLRWLETLDLETDVEAFSVPNCPLMLDETKRLLRSRFITFGPGADYDRHWRLFHKTRVKYTDQIHSSGITVQKGAQAPDDAMILHFDWIIRGYEERLKKFERYRRQSDLAAGRTRHFGLWEDVPLSWHCPEAAPSQRLTLLARAIAGKADGAEASMSAAAEA